MADPVQVAVEGPYPALPARVAHLVDAVDPTGTQQRLVQRLRHVRRHHDHDPVLRRRLRAHAQGTPHDPVEEATRLLQTRYLGEQCLQRSVDAGRATTTAGNHETCLRQCAACRGARIRHPVTGVTRVDQTDPVAGGLTTVTQGVGLVKENDHAAVPQGERAQLAEQSLDLHHADAEEHGPKRARVDEDIGLPGLTGDRLRDQGLAGTGWTPQQDAAGYVAAPIFDLVRLLQIEDRLPDPGQDVILAPDVGEPGLDVLGEVHLHAAAGQEPEQQRELPDRNKHDQ